MRESDFSKTLEALEVGDGKLLVGVSGGRDSMVLLDLLQRASSARHLELVVAHVNHALRGEESDADERMVRETAALDGLAFCSQRVAPESDRTKSNSRSRPSLEEAARNLRRASLLAFADEHDCRWIATAHHAGDQAETVLLRILRGTGPDGLAAMAPRSPDGRWIKPLLGVLPEAIQEWAARHRILWREDESNGDRRFARNRLRHDWIQGLSDTFNPQLLRTLGDLAEAERRDLEWIEGLVRDAAKERIEIGPAGIQLAIDGWDQVPEALARRLVRNALVDVGLARDVTRSHLMRVLDFLRRGRSAGRDRRIELPMGVVLRRLDDVFLLSADPTRKRVDGHDNARVLGRD